MHGQDQAGGGRSPLSAGRGGECSNLLSASCGIGGRLVAVAVAVAVAVLLLPLGPWRPPDTALHGLDQWIARLYRCWCRSRWTGVCGG